MKNPINFLEEMSNFTFVTKYARYDANKQRRETWNETVSRVEKMHLKKYSFLDDKDKQEIIKAFDLVREKKVSPSMRAMQFAGKAIEAHNARMYNCGVRHIDSIRAFSESFYILLCGTGIGYGITDKFLNRLPNLVNAADKNGVIINFSVLDTIEGWADSVEALLNCYFKNTAYSGRKIVFDYSHIRKEGSLLKTGGGKAPGYKGLKNCHIKIKKLLDYVIEEKNQTRLKTIDAYDILMFCADAVLSGGVRRSACSVIFNINDKDMINAKTGNWMKENPQRARSNNSVLILRNKVTFDEFQKILLVNKEFGEPGFVFTDSEDQLLNPCFEISFIPITDDGICGYQFCNLSSLNGAKADSLEKFKEYAWGAALIGTLQAGYTHFPYLTNVSEQLCKSEYLLGVSITGIMNNPHILLNPEFQRIAAKVAVETNEIWAKKLKIGKAARVTCVKPEGTNSIILMSGSGIHPHHDRKYIRRIQCNKLENVYKFFKLYNPHACEPSIWSENKTDDIISFPIEVDAGSMIKSDLTAIKHLNFVKLTQENWVNSGTTNANKKSIHNSVSCTITVRENEWDEVTNFIFKNKQFFTAISLLPDHGDKTYKQSPMESVKTPQDEEKFNNLIKNWQKVDFTKLVEEEDETKPAAEGSCVNGSCQLVKV